MVEETVDRAKTKRENAEGLNSLRPAIWIIYSDDVEPFLSQFVQTMMFKAFAFIVFYLFDLLVYNSWASFCSVKLTPYDGLRLLIANVLN